MSGEVDNIGKTIFGTMYVTFRRGGLFSVQCSFDDEWSEELAELSPGQSIRIAGICRGKLGNVAVEKCHIVPAGYKSGK